ncbi:hypothetical protein MalM25_17260 [Planctomycetes bacterium MalM25]|nr:hypothetical protein MalM25_17260 [Planctomycetes bacterium MalM25]
MPASPEMIMPTLLMALPWGMTVVELRRGLKRGEMREYLRRDYTECGHDRLAKYCQRDREPKTFWCLFAFYLFFAIAIPIGITYAWNQPEETPKPKPSAAQNQEASSV